jgi:hypothetical protein
MTPFSAFAYLGYWRNLSHTFIEGAIIGAVVLGLRNIISSDSFSKNQNKIIDYLAGLINIGKSYLNPTSGFAFSIATSGIVCVKTIFSSKIFKKYVF